MACRPVLGVLAAGSLALAVPAVAQDGAGPGGTTLLPTIDVVTTTPLPGLGVDVEKVPSAVTIVPQSAITRTQSPNVVKALTEQVPSISVGESSGNSFQPDVSFRGFVASPVAGTPEGIAVYQNGVRINEAFGDTVNWDLIPTIAIRDIGVVSNNPAFGLNALGGAVSIQMQDGFGFQGVETQLMGGSFGRIQGSVQAGKQVGDFAAYIAIEGVHEDGFRRDSASDIRRLYGDVGYKTDTAEFHLNVEFASNNFGASASAPIELLQQDYSSIYTTPQTTANRIGFVNLTGTVQATPSWTLQGNAYVRVFNQAHVDGNSTDVEPCKIPSLLCFGDNSTPANGSFSTQLGNPFAAGSSLGEIDDTTTRSIGYGASLQATNTDKLLGHENRFVVGLSLDTATTKFGANSQLGVIDPTFMVDGAGLYLGASGDPTSIGPVSLQATNIYGGLFAIDTFDVTDRLSITAGGRFNVANIDLKDQLGGDVNGNSTFQRFNPLIGLTYKITPDVGAYAGYSEANRAPTPLELGCADPLHPCIIDSFLVSDPALKQVVARTVEAGLRGSHELGPDSGRIGWKVGVFHTENFDDIQNIPSPVQGFGYFQNVGRTLRQGVEAEANYKSDTLFVYASYAFVDATFRTPVVLGSPNNPFADADGNIAVKPGDQIPLVPRNRVKAGFDYNVTEIWKVGADVLYTGAQYYDGDASNLNAKLPSYKTVDLHSSYRVTKSVEVFGQIENLFDSHYYNYGTFFDTGQIAFANFTDPRSVSPGRPRAFYAGIKATF